MRPFGSHWEPLMRHSGASCVRYCGFFLKNISRNAPWYKALRDQDCGGQQGAWVNLGNLAEEQASSSNQAIATVGSTLAGVLSTALQSMQTGQVSSMNQLAQVMSGQQMQSLEAIANLQRASQANVLALLQQQRESLQMGPEAFENFMQDYFRRQRAAAPPPPKKDLHACTYPYIALPTHKHEAKVSFYQHEALESLILST